MPKLSCRVLGLSFCAQRGICFRRAWERQIERFQRWCKAGAIHIAGMQYNMTPLLNLEQMHYVVRRLRRSEASGQFLPVPEDAGVLLTAKPAEDGNSIVVRVQNLRGQKTVLPLNFITLKPASAHVTSPVENEQEALEVKDTAVTVRLKPL